MDVVDAQGDPPPAGAIERAVAALRRAQVVAIPTDTVYGLAADPFRPGAVDRLFAAKSRPRTVELPVLVADEAQALELTGQVDPTARRLMARWWPGPLTLVLARRPGLGLDLGDNEATIGLRCPDHPVARAIATRFGPIATTSANRHGEPPLTTAAGVAEAMGDAVGLALDGGTCDGAPSSVLDCTGANLRLLREGGLAWSAIQAGLE
jgi:L-threonylcarbamoyladenylate synthase